MAILQGNQTIGKPKTKEVTQTVEYVCPKCGEHVLENTEYCPKCGESLYRYVRQCGQCGHNIFVRNDEPIITCPLCGWKARDPSLNF